MFYGKSRKLKKFSCFFYARIYKGLAPVSIKKEAGVHTITLRKAGYVTKSYMVQIDEEENDITYSFSDLEREKEPVTVSGNSSVSANKTVSGNNTDEEKKNNTASGNVPDGE